MKKANALDVACPVCSAQPGQHCVTKPQPFKGGGGAVRSRPHPRRTRHAKDTDAAVFGARP